MDGLDTDDPRGAPAPEELAVSGASDAPDDDPIPLRKRLPLIAAGVVFLAWSITAVVGDRGLLELRQQKQARDALASEVAEREARLEQLGREVRLLEDEDGTARERIAREQLGYARKGEVVFVLPREERAGEGTPAAP